MKILVTVGRYPQWSEEFIRRELLGLAARGHELAVWPVEEELSRARWRRPSGLPLPPVSAVRADAPALLLALASCGWGQLRRAARALRAAHLAPWQPELVYAHFAGLPSVFGLALARAFSCRFAACAHARDVWTPYAPGLAALRRADSAVCCNEAARARLAELLPELAPRLALVRHGLPEASFAACANPLPADAEAEAVLHFAAGRKLLLGCGRFVPKKGFHVFLQALTELQTAGDSPAAALIGEGPEHLRLAQLAVELGLRRENFALFPRLSQDGLRLTLAQAELLVAPSVVDADGDRDGVPNVILEAFAAGKPVVATRTGGIPEAVRNGETGWLVEPGDPGALAVALASALADPAELARRGAAGRRLAEERYRLDANLFTLENAVLFDRVETDK